jgi:O-antigen biosynthesis protein
VVIYSRPDIISAWHAANMTSQMNNVSGRYPLVDFTGDPTKSRISLNGDRQILTCSQIFSLIICDSGDDAALKNTLASLLVNDSSCAQIIVAGSARRTCNLRVLLHGLGASGAVDLHAADDVISFAELQASSLGVARGEFIAFLTAGDLLEPDALGLLRAVALHESGANIIFTDEDWIDDKGSTCCPRLKTGWDPDAQLGRDHFGHLCLLRRSRVEETGGFRLEHSPAHEYDLHCRIAFSVAPPTIRHVPLVLCHRAIPRDETNEKNARETFERAARIVAQLAAQELCGEPVNVTPAPLAPFINRIHWPLPVPVPLVSILVPTRDRADLVRNCVEGLLTRTDYDNLEILILDNDSVEPATFQLFAQLSADRRVRVVSVPGPFNFSRINNDGAREARGEILVFLNNDIEIGEGGWLREMVSQTLRPDVGCVGARMLYGDRHVQHAGIVLQPGPLAMHVFRRRHESEIGFDAQLAGTRTYAAVTAACLAVRRSLFDRVGGFDQHNLQVSFQDVDLCLKIEELGYRNICTPFEPLLHLEGSSREVGVGQHVREHQELRCLVQRWNDRFYGDRFGHPLIRLDWENPERLMPLPQGAGLLDLIR